MLAKEYPYRQIFASAVKPLVSEEKDRMLAIASMQELSTFVPYIDTEKNIDLLPIAFDACVINRVNKNGDLIDTNIALATYKSFINKFIDTEHNRQKVIGVILSASLSEFGSNRLLREEDVVGKDIPFNITLGGVLWRAVNGDLCDLVEEANDPTSDNYMNVSASWELGFSDYKILELEKGEKNLSQGVVIMYPELIHKVKKYLKCYGGSGVYDGKSYSRMPCENVIAMGVGLTEKPAAEVRGIALKLEEPAEVSQPEEPILASNTTNNINNSQIISQNVEYNVKRERESNMKITSIADITDENLKQCSASVIAEFISSELRKANEAYSAEKHEQATANQNLKASTEALSKTVQEMQASLENLQKEKVAREKVDAFNARMEEVIASYELPEDVTKVVAVDLANISSAEAFASWKERAEILLKAYSKTALAAAKAAKCKADDEEMEAKKAKAAADEAEAAKKKASDKNNVDDIAKADDEDANDGTADASKKKKNDKKKDDKKEAIASAVEGALDNADKKDKGLPNSSSSASPGLKEKYATAFAEENFVIKK